MGAYISYICMCAYVHGHVLAPLPHMHIPSPLFLQSRYACASTRRCAPAANTTFCPLASAFPLLFSSTSIVVSAFLGLAFSFRQHKGLGVHVCHGLDGRDSGGLSDLILRA